MSIDEIKQLDISECILLVEEIWDSIAQEQEHVGLSVYEKEVLDARLAAYKENSDQLISWDEIKNKFRA